MNDAVKALRLPDPVKKIRGHAKIELFDAKTGELVQKVEKDNLVTNALTRLVNAVAGGAPGSMADLVMPVATKALGGIMLFDGELTEDADNCEFPMDVSLVAYGNRGVNTSNTRGGSLNGVESGPIAGGYRSVWDFGTSQANGTIKSVGLCGSNADPFIGSSDIALHNVLNSSGNEFNACAPVYVDEDGEYVYVVYGSGNYSSSYDSQTRIYTYTHTITINVYKERIPLTNYKVGDYVNHRGWPPEYVTSKTITIVTTGDSLPDYSDPTFAAAPSYDGKVRFTWMLGNGSGNGTVFLLTMDCSDFSFSEVQTISLANTYLRKGHAVICGGYMYLMSNNMHSVYKVDMSNTANIAQITLPDGFYLRNSSGRTLIPHPNGGLTIDIYTAAANGQSGYYDHYKGFINTDGVITLEGGYSARDQYNGRRAGRITHLWDYDHMMTFGYENQSAVYYGGYGRTISNYLGTIANLASPITKNASQTLKVTYELYDA